MNAITFHQSAITKARITPWFVLWFIKPSFTKPCATVRMHKVLGRTIACLMKLRNLDNKYLASISGSKSNTKRSKLEVKHR